MRLISRKGSVSIFLKTSSWDDGVVIFVGEKRSDITLEQFNKLADVNEKDGMDGFVSCCMSMGITIDKNQLN